MTTRNDGRGAKDLRKIKINRNYIKYPEGSVLIEMGETKVICNATVEEGVPGFKRGSGEGWVTAEYSMLPRATDTRNKRDIAKLKLNHRSTEIQRLIGRSLRAAVDFKALGERTITIDCDVIQADGGTRTASITGGYIALYDACKKLMESGVITEFPIKNHIAAVSVGIVNDECLLDLCYFEDSSAKVDMNVVMNDKGEFVEVQATGEQGGFSESRFIDLLDYAKHGCAKILEIQKSILKPEESISMKNYPKEIIFATKNKGKLKEIKRILEDTGISILSMEDAGINDDIMEDGETFEANAIKKAEEIMEKTGRIVLADDSGLEIDCLNKAPGVYSSRFLGKDTDYFAKNNHILGMLENVPEEERTARFVCVIAAASPFMPTITTKGVMEGIIAREQKGGNGFGYDPIFFLPEYQKTSAEIPPELKNEISHRGKALRNMKGLLKELFEASK